jgi:primosomal protein N''
VAVLVKFGASSRAIKSTKIIVERFDRKLVSQQNGNMKTTVELPDKLIREIKLRAVEDDKKLKDVFAELLICGLDVKARSATKVRADDATMKKRRELLNRFVAGDWGVELTGLEASQKLDRTKAKKRAQRWRD